MSISIDSTARRYLPGSRLVLPRSAPGGAPLGGFPTAGDIDRFPRDRITSEFINTAAAVPRSAVIPDGAFDHPEPALAAYPPDSEFHGHRIRFAPRDEVGFPFKPLLGLRKLYDCIIMVDLVTNILVDAYVFQMAL